MKPVIRQAAFSLAFLLLFALGCSRKAEPPPEPVISAEEANLHKATLLMQRAIERRKAHRWTEALEAYETAKRLAPDDPEVHRGVKLFERLAPLLPQIRELDARLALTPDDDQLLCDRALLFLRGDDNELALADSEAAGRKAEWAVRPKLFRALALIGLGRVTECDSLGIERPLRLSALTPEFLETMSRLDSEISLERENADLYISRAWQLNEIGQPRLALADAENAMRFNATSGSARLERGYALAKLGRADEALEELNRATELDPKLSLGWQYRGELALARGDYKGALDSLEHALAINPTAEAQRKREQAEAAITQSGAR